MEERAGLDVEAAGAHALAEPGRGDWPSGHVPGNRAESRPGSTVVIA
jgi:hypothetical protein